MFSRVETHEEITCFVGKGSLEDAFYTKKEVLENTAGLNKRFEKLKRVHGGLDRRAKLCTCAADFNL